VTPVPDTVLPVVDTVGETLTPILDTVDQAVTPVTDTLAPVLETVAPVTDTVAPILDTVDETLAPLVERVNEPLATVPAPVSQAPAPVAAAPVAALEAPAPTPLTTVLGSGKEAPAANLASPLDPGTGTFADLLTMSRPHVPAHPLRTDARAPHAPAPAPPTPTGAPGPGVSGSFSPPPAGLFLALLTALFFIPCLRYGRVVLAPARWRPVLFVSLLERLANPLPGS
jgi:hypothetical protein